MVASDVGRNPETGAEVRERRFRLCDNYSRFFLKYIEPEKLSIDTKSFEFGGLDRFAGWNSILGLQFENLVLNNWRDLARLLHLDGAIIKSAAPYVKRGSRTDGNGGCQIDLLIQAKMSMFVVEIKRQVHIGREIIDEMREKCKRLRKPHDVSLRTALVYEGELEPSVEADGYFDAIVPFSQLLFG